MPEWFHDRKNKARTMKGMLMMKTKWMAVVAAVAMAVSATADAMSLEGLEKGARAVSTFNGDAESLSDEDAALGMEVVTFVQDFYQWLPSLSMIAEKDSGKPQKNERMLVTPEMKTAKYFTAGLVKFIAKHKPQGVALKPGPGAPVVLAWYISQHPDSGSSEKASMDSLLVDAFGENYPGQEEVVAEINAAREKEEKLKAEKPDAGAGEKKGE